MTTKKIEKGAWRKYFSRFTEACCKDTVPDFSKVEVLTADMGVQLETSKGELLGVTYDHKDDALEIEFPGLVHRIYHPVEIYAVEDEDGNVMSFKIVVEKLDLKLHQGREEILTISHSLGVKGLLEAGGVK